MPTDHTILFTPGPTEVSAPILAELARPIIGHRGEEMQGIIGAIKPRARRLFGAPADHEIFLSGSSATGLWEAAIRNTVARRLLAVVNGAFSERFGEVAQACGVEVDRLEVPWGRAVEPDAVAARLSEGRYDAVALVHNETSTGVANPLQAVSAAVARFPDVVLLVDMVSSLAGLPVDVGRDRIDVALASVQKCLALPPGLALCAVSPRAMERSRGRTGKGYYFDFVRLKGFFDKNMPMATPSVGHIRALGLQLERIETEGLERRHARHRAMGETSRAWAEKRFALYAAPGCRSDTITCVEVPAGFDLPALLKGVKRRGFALGSGYGAIKPTTFRIGHMGDHTPEVVGRLLAAMDETIEEIRR
ncbi:MAG TPA: alanine--glyoxylate aminotransferase family protein [Candidatus Polarisedimenticolia bacterium]|nr:alanine--glyoxylate aminotransferase family protein [Candidatus Polarisedimenticolia bacterium]